MNAKYGQIADSESVNITAWKMHEFLHAISENEARFSKGFLCSEFSTQYSSISKYWIPFFYELGATVSFISARPSFSSLPMLSKIYSCELDNEPALIGLDQIAADLLVKTISPNCDKVGEDVILEYLCRRFVSTLSKTRNTFEISSIMPEQNVNSIPESFGILCLHFELQTAPFEIWLGLGVKAIEKLDSLWRSVLVTNYKKKEENVFSDRIYQISVELAELAVPPAMLIDYMRTGTIIDLDIPVSSSVRVRCDNEIWMEGELCQFRDNLAVKVENLNPVVGQYPSSTTRVRVELARTELDYESVIEHYQKSAVLITETPINSLANLIIRGEDVAVARIGMLNNNFALSIVPK